MRIKIKETLFMKLRAPIPCKRCGGHMFTLAQFPSGGWAYDCDACGLRRNGIDANAVGRGRKQSEPLVVYKLVKP